MALGIQGIGGLGGLRGAAPRYGSAGGLSSVAPGAGYSTRSAPGVRIPRMPGYQGPGALSQLSQAIGVGKTGANLMGDTELAGNFGMAGSALGLGQSLDRISKGQGTPMDYVNAAKNGYQLANGVGGALGGVGGSGLSTAEMAALNSQAGAGLSGAGELALAGEGTAGAAGTAGASTAAGAGASSGAAAGTAGAGTALGVLGLAAMWANHDLEKDSAKSLAGGSRTLQRLADAGVPIEGLLKAAYTPQTVEDISKPGTSARWLNNYSAALGTQNLSPDQWAHQSGIDNPNILNEDQFMNYIRSVPGAMDKLPGDILNDWYGDVSKNAGTLGLNQFNYLRSNKVDPAYATAAFNAVNSDPRFAAAYNDRLEKATPKYAIDPNTGATMINKEYNPFGGLEGDDRVRAGLMALDPNFGNSA